MRVSAQGAVDTKEYIRGGGLERGLFASKNQASPRSYAEQPGVVL